MAPLLCLGDLPKGQDGRGWTNTVDNSAERKAIGDTIRRAEQLERLLKEDPRSLGPLKHPGFDVWFEALPDTALADRRAQR